MEEEILFPRCSGTSEGPAAAPSLFPCPTVAEPEGFVTERGFGGFGGRDELEEEGSALLEEGRRTDGCRGTAAETGITGEDCGFISSRMEFVTVSSKAAKRVSTRC
jgi:hypothetical protein